jgi:succinate dehydrogenase cytochrome b subunit
MTEKNRPKHLDLPKIRLPLPGFVSILHRISGALMFVFTPFLLYLLQLSLVSQQSYETSRAIVGNPLVKVALFGLLWALLHHLCAGIRFLALDLHIGVALQPARASATAVLAVSLTLTLILGAWLW